MLLFIFPSQKFQPSFTICRFDKYTTRTNNTILSEASVAVTGVYERLSRP